MTITKTPIRTVYDGSNSPIGLSEFQAGEAIPIIHGGTGGNTVAEAKVNLSLTDANIRSLFSVTGGGTYNNTTGVFTIDATDLTPYETKVNVALKANIVDLTTANVVELNNLYYTNARVYSNVSPLLALKANIVDLTTANVAELNNLYYTNARVYSNVSPLLALKANVIDLTTANVAELNNLYYTDARVYSNVVLLNYATTSYVNGQISALVDSAPETLNTLNELAAALGDDSNFAATVSNNIGAAHLKANLAYTFANTLVATVAGVTNNVISNVVLAAGVNQTGILNTSNVTEGTNLYYTIERANTAIDNRVTISFIENLNGQSVRSTANPTFNSITISNGANITGNVEVTGNINATEYVTSPYFYTYSDRGLKSDIKPIPDALNIIKALQGVSFIFNSTGERSFGLIAQDLEKIIPQVVRTNSDGYKTVVYDALIAFLIEAIKTQQEQIDQIKARL